MNWGVVVLGIGIDLLIELYLYTVIERIESQALSAPPTTTMSLETLLQRADIWQANAISNTRSSLPTGFTELDQALGLGGWPQGATTELLTDIPGIGELRLLLPTLAHLSGRAKWMAWVSPPHIPYAPALAAAGVELSRVLLIHPHSFRESLWAAEQALKSGCCSLVLSWDTDKHTTGNRTVDKDLRRLQLAAKQGNCWHMLFRPLQAQRQTSPAALRLALMPARQGLQIGILKQRQRWSGQQVWLPLPDTLQTHTLAAHQLPVAQRQSPVTPAWPVQRPTWQAEGNQEQTASHARLTTVPPAPASWH